MSMKKAFIFLFVLFSSVVSAKDFDILNLTSSDGLSNSSIIKIFQDSNGLIWFGTWDGLNVYNGRDFKSYKPEPGNSNSISNNIIRDIIEERENILWIATDQGINRFDKTSNTFRRFFTNPNNQIIYNENSFFVTKNSFSQIFACIVEQGIYYYNDEVQNFFKLKIPVKVKAKKIFIDSDDNLWLLTLDKKLFKIDFKKGNLKNPVVNNIIQFKHLSDIESVFYQSGNEFWLQTIDKKMYLYNISEGTLKTNVSNFQPNDMVKAIIALKNYIIWGTTNGLYRFNCQTHNTEPLFENISILSLFSGSQSIIWVGTDTRGVLQLSPLRTKFQMFSADNIPSFSRNAVRSFYQDQTGVLWVGTKGSGIYELVSGTTTQNLDINQHFTTLNGLLSNSIYTIVPDQTGGFWIGSDGTGLNYYDPKSRSINKLSINQSLKKEPNLTSVYSILILDQTMWVGTSGNGMYKLEIDRTTRPYSIKSYKQYVFKKGQSSSLSNNIVYSIVKADNDNLWIGTRGGGLNYFNIANEQFKTFRFSSNNADLMGTDDVLSLHRDKKGFLWVGTSMGLIKLLHFDKGNLVFERYTEKEGIPNNTIHGILEDKDNNIWLSTNKGIAKFIQQKGDTRIISYYQKDGLQSNEFSDGAFYESPYNHKFYFGGINGFNTFNPSGISNSSYMPSLVLDAFYVDNAEEELSQYEINGKNGKSLHISYRINSFSFKFIPIDFISSPKCEISYLLEGYQKNWIHLGTSNTIVFSNLPKGKYVLKVCCNNADKIWSNKIYSLPIIIQPPWWNNNVAYICYAILFLLVMFGANRIITNQLKTRNEIKMKELEKQKTEEIHQAKLRFFTNIAHEFSNSLTLIYGPCIQLLNNNTDGYTRKHINTIKSNSERMQNLIQQLIDFRKAETGYLKPDFKQVDISELIKYVTDNFTEILEQKRITLNTALFPEDIYWNTDWDCIEKIVFNLLSNAVKYTPQNSEISLIVKIIDNELQIIVTNYGVGINPRKLQSVFNRFEILDRLELQASQGLETRNGIGLALCKNITELLNGNIDVKSDGETYTSFIVVIPENKSLNVIIPETQKEEPLAAETEEQKKSEINIKGDYLIPNNEKEGLILVVDDEQDIRQLLKELLTEKYEIVEAGNGDEAINAMRVRMPILIICDVIMPKMNGVEFIKIMKSQELTRHIPIILLSSKSAIENQIEGLELGADAYLGKPFHPRHLEALIDSLLRQNKAILEFNDSTYASIEQFNGKLIKKEDKDLLIKITKLIMEHIDDETLSLDSIAAEMAISKMQLYRKIKELSDQTPTEFIRNIRLNNAEKLLKTTNKTVQEIMYDCGFNNKTYFYREFAKKFKHTPKEYRNQKSTP